MPTKGSSILESCKVFNTLKGDSSSNEEVIDSNDLPKD